MEITIYEEGCYFCRSGIKFHESVAHELYGGTYFQMEEDVRYFVTYQYTLPAIGQDVTITDLPLTWEELNMICFPDVDVYNHRILEIREMS